MTSEEVVDELRRTPGVVLHAGANEADIFALEEQFGIHLPAAHRELLLLTNGIEAEYGFSQLFGVGPGAAVDLSWWNRPELWKFSWNPEIRQFLCVGTTGWGGQYAYRVSDVATPGADPPFYFFSDTFQKVAGTIGQTFSRYLEQGFLGNARKGLQGFDQRVHRRLGDVAPDELLALAPSPLLGGPKRMANVLKMPAVTAGVVNGDIWTELARFTESFTRFDGGDVAEVEPWVDDQGRGRLRLHFEYLPEEA